MLTPDIGAFQQPVICPHVYAPIQETEIAIQTISFNMILLFQK